MYYSKQGLKRNPQKNDKSYLKQNTRSNCNAKVVFRLDKNDDWASTTHVMEHNHSFLSSDEIHLHLSYGKMEKLILNIFKK